MGNTLSTKYKEYCSKTGNFNKFFCSCYRYQKDNSYKNEAECILCWFTYIMVGTGLLVIIGGALELLEFIPLLADLFETFIDLVAQLFSNFQFLGDWVLSLFQPFIEFLGKMVEFFQQVVEFIRDTFPNANENLVNILISELSAIALIHTWYGVEEAVKNWKGSVGYNIFQTLDAPFKYIKDSLDSVVLKFLFNLVTLPMQTTLFIICLMIDFVENLF